MVANLLAGGEQNPFDAREAKVYQNEPDIQAIGNLRLAYEKVDVAAFNNALREIKDMNDKFLIDNLDTMIRDFRNRAVVSMVRSYQRVSLASLAQQLQVDVPTLEDTLLQVILDGDIVGQVDQTTGVLELTDLDSITARKYQAVKQWSQRIKTSTASLTHAQPSY